LEVGRLLKTSRSYTATASGTVMASPRRSPHSGDSQNVLKATIVRMIWGTRIFRV
jgi:hypothetical protein